MPNNPKYIPIQIDDYVSKVSDKLEPLQKALFNKVSAQLKELSLDADGFIKRTSANMDIITAVKTELNGLLANPKYNAIVNSVDGMLGDIDDMQGSYFQSIDPSIVAPPVIDDITTLAFKDAKTDLTKAGFQSEIVDKASTIVQTAITEGTSYADMNSQLADFIIGNDKVDGKLVSYTKQILSDTLNNTSRNYNSIMTDKLGLKWFRYVGALVRDSRPFCKALEHKEWIHESELASISRGVIDGVQVSRAGMMPDTNKENFISRCGGWNCAHHCVPVSSESVPTNIRRKFDKNVPQSEADIVEERPKRG